MLLSLIFTFGNSWQSWYCDLIRVRFTLLLLVQAVNDNTNIKGNIYFIAYP
nr:MAG TPA: hypothetical protein [Caudoviricetes sp.]